jgi:hypothetical protein
MTERSHTRQVIGSLLVIVVVVILVATAKLGPGSGDDSGGDHGGKGHGQLPTSGSVIRPIHR